MTLKDVIQDLSVRLQHTLTEDDIVMFVNYALFDIKRVAAKLDVFRFDTRDNINLYPLPTYISGEGIKTVTVDETEYFPILPNEEQKAYVYHITPDNYINLLPIPENGSKLVIIYEGVPTIYTSTENSRA